ncbi:unnamed protein product [Tuber aestivum]|uniref:Uncharacterized protein n=1 Tax=Tuber aestivum TaxID=59557 RepID=A0A292Q415_9PEZI|nr:unnamed protein product [Tuber aestivum]
MHEAPPLTRSDTPARLRRVLHEQLLEVSRAVPAWVQSREERQIVRQCGALVDARRLREAGKSRVEEFPAGTTECGIIAPPVRIDEGTCGVCAGAMAAWWGGRGGGADFVEGRRRYEKKRNRVKKVASRRGLLRVILESSPLLFRWF